jgi:peptidoglycan L-alanyl-D-glutamate endopeptidase CwlK
MFTTVSSQRLELVHPELKRRVTAMAAILDKENIPIQVCQGLRTWSEQDALYAQGRTHPGKIVTNAKGGQSAHNFGYAVDLVPEEIEPGQPDWNIEHPAWKRMLEVGAQCGLAEGALWRTFPDNPHFYLKEFPANPTDVMQQDFKDAGMVAVWQSFNVPIDQQVA